MVNKHQPPLKSDIGVNPFPCYDCTGNSCEENQLEVSFNENCNHDNKFTRSYSNLEDYAAHLLEDVHKAEAEQLLKAMHRRRSANILPKNNNVRKL